MRRCYALNKLIEKPAGRTTEIEFLVVLSAIMKRCVTFATPPDVVDGDIIVARDSLRPRFGLKTNHHPDLRIAIRATLQGSFLFLGENNDLTAGGTRLIRHFNPPLFSSW